MKWKGVLQEWKSWLVEIGEMREHRKKIPNLPTIYNPLAKTDTRTRDLSKDRRAVRRDDLAFIKYNAKVVI